MEIKHIYMIAQIYYVFKKCDLDVNIFLYNIISYHIKKQTPKEGTEKQAEYLILPLKERHVSPF
jgi:hypothetical protein